MRTQKNKNTNRLISIGIAALVLAPLSWALILLIRGMLQWSHSDNEPLAQSSHLASFNKVPDVPAGLFSYGGSPAWAGIRRLADSAISSERPEFQFRYVQPISAPAESGIGIQMLLDGQLSFAQTSRPLLQAEYRLAQERGFKLEQIPVAVDAIAFVVHPSLEIVSVSLEHLRQIYSGKILNWKKLGGPNVDIIPLSRRKSTDGTVSFFTQNIIDSKQLGSNVKFVSTTTEALRLLASTPGGIYFDSASTVLTQCSSKPLTISRDTKQLISPYEGILVPSADCPKRRNRLNIGAFQTGRYPITRYLYVVIKKNNRLEEKAGQAYANFLLTDQGQTLISKAGFVRIH